MELVTDSEYQVREVQAAPYASSLIEGHRDFGYSLETALADIVDNSITAGASEIRITAIISSDSPYIAIVDNGSGMTESELVEAMKLGANHPMGPLQLADFIGLDTCLAIMNVLHEGLADTKYRPCPLLTKYVEAGWLGRKTQRGFYDYRGETPVPTR